MKEHKIGYFLIVLASIIIVLAGIKGAASIIIPLLLSLFIAIILSPLYNYFNKKNVPEVLSIIIVISMFVVLLGLIIKLVGTSFTDFSSNIDMYSDKLLVYYKSYSEYADILGISLHEEELSNIISSKRIMTFSATIFHSISSIFANSFIIILSVVFMLLESKHFENKVNYTDETKGTMTHIYKIFSKIKSYMVIKALISLLTGFIIWLSLSIVGTDYAFLWGVSAFLLNFIPNIGSIIAAIPAVIISLVQLGTLSAFIVAIIYFSVNIIIGSIIEPKVMGKGLGLSTLVVFLSLLFWGWLLGIVGMLLSIPLTIMAKIAFDANQDTKWIAVLLGTGEEIKD